MEKVEIVAIAHSRYNSKQTSSSEESRAYVPSFWDTT
jgi:hypothetical protein